MRQNEAIDTIVAEASPPGKGGVGVIRISGPQTGHIANCILGKIPKVRQGEYLPFLDRKGEIMDCGIALFFKAPHSFTGEDILELQGHGGPVIMDCLIREVVAAGARLAEPGEFSLRAFLNNKIDLLQAEAISDLISASTEAAARRAVSSLQGVFSKLVHSIVEDLISLRMYIEAALDFPEEEIDFLRDEEIPKKINNLIKDVELVSVQAHQGALRSEGVKVVIAGKPNAGKSSLLNALSGYESAIVTDIPGTTRDVLREHISMDGLLVQFIDTAGLRLGADIVEQEGIRRALQEVERADHIVWVVDGETTEATDPSMLFSEVPEMCKKLATQVKTTVLYNKIDKISKSPKKEEKENYTVIYASVKTGEGMSLFREHLKQTVGFRNEEGGFIARRRHLEALTKAKKHLQAGQTQLTFRAPELLAEELRHSQLALDEITGRFSNDDLLGKIFSEFCIGK